MTLEPGFLRSITAGVGQSIIVYAKDKYGNQRHEQSDLFILKMFDVVVADAAGGNNVSSAPISEQSSKAEVTSY